MSNIFQNVSSLDVSPFDVYLQPHSDDICFSLGALAYKNSCGILLTVFPISAYMPNPRDAAYPFTPPKSQRPSSDWITKSRINEDKAFAAACKLETRFLEIPCASFLGHESFNLAWVNQNQQRITSALLNTLLTIAAHRPSRLRSWLFCPSGIGGHVDHVAVRSLVNQNINLLSLYYRIGFYEDLPYASNTAARSSGINILRNEMRNKQLHRYAFPFREYVSEKLSLTEIYSSQFLDQPSIDQFAPAADVPNAPHEAFWSLETFGN